MCVNFPRTRLVLAERQVDATIWSQHLCGGCQKVRHQNAVPARMRRLVQYVVQPKVRMQKAHVIVGWLQRRCTRCECCRINAIAHCVAKLTEFSNHG
jgi:hypothetical protein